MKAVLFDLDGTLLDTLQDIADSGNAALTEHGLPAHPESAYRYFVGDGVQTLIGRIVPHNRQDPATLTAVAQAYRREYEQRWNARTQPYPGIPQLLDALTVRQIPMTVFSNKPDDFTQRCVSELLPHWKFAYVLGASAKLPKKPDPSGALLIAGDMKVPPGDFLYVGDTATDMQTALAAGMFPVGALWGFRPESELRAAGARRLIATPAELLTI